jgi:threonine dehydrogenase-like Zn-dependent dehydrogenase
MAKSAEPNVSRDATPPEKIKEKPQAPRRSTGQIQVARAVWYTKPGVVEIRAETLKAPTLEEARVRTQFTGISRGTERLILSGAVAPSEWERMRAPLQGGDFPFPVKYGYCATGVVEIGPKDLIGKIVFCLHPHQDVFNAPTSMLVPVPDGVSARRATLAANVETALNALWDAGSGPADKITIVGAGVIGLLVGALAARLPGAEVTIVDVDTSRKLIAESLGATFAAPDAAPIDCDVVFHTSVTQAGLNTAIKCAGNEGTIIELSWYGEKPVTIDLGGPFHSKRLKLISSQVGQVSPSRRPRWTYRRRLEAALNLLKDARLDALVADQIKFDDCATALPALLDGRTSGFAPVIAY